MKKGESQAWVKPGDYVFVEKPPAAVRSRDRMSTKCDPKRHPKRRTKSMERKMVMNSSFDTHQSTRPKRAVSGRSRSCKGDEDNLEDLDMEIQQLRAGDANLQQLWSCS